MERALLPIACTLNNGELRERRENVLKKLSGSLIDFEELENGFSYRFPADDSLLLDLVNVINLERKCCPFLNFKLAIESGNNTVSLAMTGAEGTKEFLESFFTPN
jgi:hypothetical protein